MKIHNILRFLTLSIAVIIQPYNALANVNEEINLGKESFLRTVFADGDNALPILDCDTLVKNREITDKQRFNDCNVLKRGDSIFAFPQFHWASFRPQDITDKFDEWEETRRSTGAFQEFREKLKLDPNLRLDADILNSGNAAAAQKFIDIHSQEDGTEIYGGVTLTSKNRNRVNIFSQKLRNVNRPPTIMAFYDQYDGNLYLHAFKLQRTGANHVETLHTRISPLHLDALQGNRDFLPENAGSSDLADQHFRNFYNPDKPYLFEKVDYAGAYVIAGRVAKMLDADLAVFFVPQIDVSQTKKTSGGWLKKKITITTRANIEPRWYYAFPQTTISKEAAERFHNVGFTSAICGGELTPEKLCESAHKIIPSEMVVLKASDLSPNISSTPQHFFEGVETFKSFTFLAKIIFAAIAAVVLVYMLPLLTGGLGGALGGLGKAATFLGKTLGGVAGVAAAGGGAYAVASIANGARNFLDVQRGFAGKTISSGTISDSLSVRLQGGMMKDVSKKLNETVLSKHDLSNSTIESINLLYRGVCDNDRERVEDCRLKRAVALNQCTSADTVLTCREKLGRAFNKVTGIIPRPDQFFPAEGADAVVALFVKDEKGGEALRKVRGASTGAAPASTPSNNFWHCKFTTGEKSPCYIQYLADKSRFVIVDRSDNSSTLVQATTLISYTNNSRLIRVILPNQSNLLQFIEDL